MIQELFSDARQDIDHARMFEDEMESKIRDLTLWEYALLLREDLVSCADMF